MSETAKVVPIARGRRRATRAKPRAAAGALEQRVHELERELRDEREAKRADSLLVALARAMLDDPHWGWHAAKALGADVVRPPQYQRAGPKLWAPAAAKA